MRQMYDRVKQSVNESGLERIARRQAQREEAQREAFRTAKSTHKGDIPVDERVAEAARKLEGTNVSQAIELIQSSAPQDQEFLVLAEMQGKNRKMVLGQFPKPRAAYVQPGGPVANGQPAKLESREADLGSPETTLDDAVATAVQEHIGES